MIDYIEEKYFTNYLECVFGNQNSFYKKAKVYKKDDFVYLKSYETIVACVDFKNKLFYVKGYYSQTTARHINDFLRQYNCIDFNIGKKKIEEFVKLSEKEGLRWVA